MANTLKGISIIDATMILASPKILAIRVADKAARWTLARIKKHAIDTGWDINREMLRGYNFVDSKISPDLRRSESLSTIRYTGKRYRGVRLVLALAWYAVGTVFDR